MLKQAQSKVKDQQFHELFIGRSKNIGINTDMANEMFF